MQGWEELLGSITACSRCDLRSGCQRVVPGEGDVGAALMFVGEGPGKDEDEQGRPFVGAAGQLLNRMISAMGLERGQTYIANVVKCRPPFNRVPTREEQEACMPFLRAQFLLIRPKVIVCLGATAGRALIDPEMRITKARGEWIVKKGVWMMPTYHPAALLRTPELKRDAWLDLKRAREKLDELGAYPNMQA